MEKEFFNDLRSRIDDLQGQLDALRAQLESALAEPADAPFTEPVDISLDDPFLPDTPASSEPEPTPEPEPVAITEPEPLPEPEPIPEEPKTKSAVKMDYQWAKDIPGGPVSNIISGISLNDRVLLINTLFKEDPMLFQNTIGAFNNMECFADACDYIQEHFPDWNLSSETVYRLMMAVRRKLN